MLAELQALDESKGWQRLFQRLNWEASQKAGSLTAARLPENRQLNRYRDVLPYDHSRVILKDGPPDYINANLVEISRLNRRYILTQGPLSHTAKHFWQMIWEQNTTAIIMLNRVVEKNQVKCFQYWPCGQAADHSDMLEFEDFKVYYLKEVGNDYFTIRTLELENFVTGEKRCIYHFHYQTWPDFGVPTSPATFLAFLFEVRQKGVLSPDVGPSVIHCSAGIGRSGTFVMVDSILKEIESTGDMEQISITDVLLEIRQYRVGLIQTPDQLRFTYLAILEGVKVLMPAIYQKATENHWKANEERENEKENLDEVTTGDAKSEEDSGDETPPPVPERRRPEDAASTADEPRAKIIRLSEDEQSGHSAGEEIESSQVSTKEDIKKGNEIPSGQTELLQAEEEDKEAVHQVNNDSSEVEKASEQGKGEPMKSKAEKQETSEVIQEAGTGPQETSEAIKVEGENEFIRTANETTKTESATEIRRRKRAERNERITNLVGNIKKKVQREEDAKAWKSRLKKAVFVAAVCSIAYVTLRYLTSG
ncbi:tyrosine-protein phosphatase non-receptor type 2-like isoform X2 [Acropora muricata]|uniref:tyrosine-protein phosphatase non-receptor type 2-like isoform X2 n=1 Tax=Acropora muricata TaxID=159855 RepID=UPI0034E43DB5